jgi:hypothetical protein
MGFTLQVPSAVFWKHHGVRQLFSKHVNLGVINLHSARAWLDWISAILNYLFRVDIQGWNE